MIAQSRHEISGHSIEDLILAELDGALSSFEQDLLMRHIGECLVCQSARMRHRTAHARLVRSLPTASESARARVESLRRIRSRTALSPSRRRIAVWPRLIARSSSALGIAVAAVALAIVVVTFRNSVAAPSGPDRVELIRRETASLGMQVVFSIEEGRAVARPDARTGVAAVAELRFASPQESGSMQIRVREPGNAYGFLALAPDLTGARRLRIEGSFPRVDYGTTITYEVWVHVETANGVFETEPVLVDIRGVTGGEHATLH